MATAKKIVMAAAGVSSGPTLTQAFHSGVLSGGTSQSSYSTWEYTFTAPALPSGYASGERHFFVMTGTRDSQGAISQSRAANTLSSLRIVNSANSIDVTTARTSMTVEADGHSDYNSAIIGQIIADAVGSTTITVTRSYSHGGGSDYVGVLVVDGVTTINSSDANGVSTASSTSSVTVSGVTTGTAGTSQLRMVVGASSNSGSANPVYNKTTNEPTYTTLGQGENGTSERYGMFYSFEAAGGGNTQAIDGTVTTSTASGDGIGYAAAVVNLS